MLKTTAMVSAENLSKISWETVGEGLANQQSISSELAGKVLGHLKDIHESSTASAKIKGMATQTLFFLPDIIRSANYGDTKTVVHLGAMLAGDAAANHLYVAAVNTLASVLPAGRAELLRKLPVTSPIFKAVTIYSIVELHKKLNTSSVSSEERDTIKHKLAEQYVTLGLMTTELFGFEATPLWIGLIVEQLIFDAETFRQHYHINTSLWEAFLMSLGFEQDKLQTVLEERQLVRLNLDMTNKMSDHFKTLYGWTLVKIPPIGALEWRKVDEFQIPSDVKEKIINQKSTLSYIPIFKEIRELNGFRLIKFFKQKMQVLHGTAVVARGKLVSSMWQKAIYKTNASKTSITFSPDDICKPTTENNDYFLEVYSGDISNWHKFSVRSDIFQQNPKPAATSEAIQTSENIFCSVQSADSVAVYVNNHTFVDSCDKRNSYIAFDPREGDIMLNFTLTGIQQIERFNLYNNVSDNHPNTGNSNTCNPPYLLTIQVGHKFYPDSLEFPNNTGEFVLRDGSNKIFSQYVITGDMNYSVQDFTNSTSIDFPPYNETSRAMCREINGGPSNFTIDTWQCLGKNKYDTSNTESSYHISSASMFLSGNKNYLKLNTGSFMINHSLTLSAAHVDIQDARGKIQNYSRINFGTEVASFNTSLRGDIIIYNHPVTLQVAGKISTRNVKVYYEKSAHNGSISFYKIELDGIEQILSNLSRSDPKLIGNSVVDIKFSCCGANFRWRNESPANTMLSIIGQLKKKTASLQINKDDDKITLLNEDNSTAAVVILHHTPNVFIEDGLILQNVISTEKFELTDNYYHTGQISGMLSDLLRLIATFDYIKNILIFREPHGYHIIHSLKASAKIHSRNIDYILQNGSPCATKSKDNVINGHDLIEYNPVKDSVPQVTNCGVCFHKNLTESYGAIVDNGIIINNLVLQDLNKGTRIYFGREEVFPVEALEDTLLGRNQSSVSGRGVAVETDGSLTERTGTSPPGASSFGRGHHRSRRAGERVIAAVSGAGPATSSAVNRAIRTLKDGVMDVWCSMVWTRQRAVPEGGHVVGPGTGEHGSFSRSLPFQLNGALGLLDLAVRKLSGAKLTASEVDAPSLLEAQGEVLSIVAGFEHLLGQLAQEGHMTWQEGTFDPIALQKNLLSKLVNGLDADVCDILYDSICIPRTITIERKQLLISRINIMLKTG